MTKIHRLGAIAAAASMLCSGAAFADSAETKGGLKIKTDDGRFEFNVNGRIHFDTFLFSEDESAVFGSGTLDSRGGTAFRRAYLTLSGKAYGWKYKFENDFAVSGGSPGSFREMWVSTTLGPGELTLGQFKPYRGMEELTSSNEITMLERPVTSASGIYAGRQFLMGAGYKGILADQFGYGVDVMNLGGANTTSEGLSYGGRFYWFPMAAEGNALHLGLSYSVDHEDLGSAGASPAFTYAGRRGPAVSFGTAGGALTGGAANGNQDTIGLELGWGFGPFTLQGEYATATLDDSATSVATGAVSDTDVDAMYLQASWFITGEKKPYKKDRGAFGSPKPNGPGGAWELTARYESIENKDESADNQVCSAPVVAPFAITPDSVTECAVDQFTVGVNWYLNPNVRFMLNYYMANADAGTAEDEPDALTLRTQLYF